MSRQFNEHSKKMFRNCDSSDFFGRNISSFLKDLAVNKLAMHLHLPYFTLSTKFQQSELSWINQNWFSLNFQQTLIEYPFSKITFHSINFEIPYDSCEVLFSKWTDKISFKNRNQGKFPFQIFNLHNSRRRFIALTIQSQRYYKDSFQREATK